MKLNIESQTILYFILIFVGASGLVFTTLLPKPEGFYAFVLAAALGGFGVAFNIWHTKSNKGHLVCPTGSNCNIVVTSRYSKFFGIPLEYLGMLYFIVIIASYLALIFLPELREDSNVVIAVALMTIGAALFSCYLLFVQAVLLRAWCIWCILASFLSLTVFFMSLISLPQWTAFLANYLNIIEMLQFLGYALGLGGVTAAIFLFFNRFIKDRSIEDSEFDTLKGFSELVWFGFGLVIMMQLALMVIEPEILQNGPFLVGLIALLISGFAGAIIMVILNPFMVFIPFADSPDKKTWLSKLRKPVFIIGAVAVTSWYFTFFTHFMPEGYSFGFLSTIYLLIIAIAITVSVIWEEKISKEKETVLSSEELGGQN